MRGKIYFTKYILCIVAGGIPLSVLGFILSLVVTFSNKCTWCCTCCNQQFELGALMVSSPNKAFVLGPNGELLEEVAADVEEQEEELTKKEEEEEEGAKDNRKQEAQEKENIESFKME